MAQTLSLSSIKRGLMVSTPRQISLRLSIFRSLPSVLDPTADCRSEIVISFAGPRLASGAGISHVRSLASFENKKPISRVVPANAGTHAPWPVDQATELVALKMRACGYVGVDGPQRHRC